MVPSILILCIVIGIVLCFHQLQMMLVSILYFTVRVGLIGYGYLIVCVMHAFSFFPVQFLGILQTDCIIF